MRCSPRDSLREQALQANWCVPNARRPYYDCTCRTRHHIGTRVRKEGTRAQDGVVRIHDTRGSLPAGQHCEPELLPLPTVNRQTFQEYTLETRTGVQSWCEVDRSYVHNSGTDTRDLHLSTYPPHRTNHRG